MVIFHCPSADPSLVRENVEDAFVVPRPFGPGMRVVALPSRVALSTSIATTLLESLALTVTLKGTLLYL